MNQPRPDPNWRPPGGPQPRNRFFEKLGVYLAGIAIGLLLLGWFQIQKQAAIKREQASNAASSEPTP